MRDMTSKKKQLSARRHIKSDSAPTPPRTRSAGLRGKRGLFADLLDIRKGGEDMKDGTGDTRVESLTSLPEWEEKACALRDLYRWTLGREPAGYARPLAFAVEREEDVGECLKRTVSYEVGGGERVTAYLLVPKHLTGRVPGVLAIHPTNECGREESIGTVRRNGRTDMAYGLHLVRRGYVTLAYDIDSTHNRSYAGERSFGNGPFYQRHPEWSARGKDIVDVSRAVDALQQTAEVDPERIGAIGHSQGGGITMDAMVLEPRIKAGVNNCGDWPFRLSKNPFNRCRLHWWIGTPRLRPFALTGKPFPIDLHEKMALAAPRASLSIVALDDFQYTKAEASSIRQPWLELADSVRGVYRLYAAEDRFDLVLHTRGHSFGEEDRRYAYAFMDKHLK